MKKSSCHLLIALKSLVYLKFFCLRECPGWLPITVSGFASGGFNRTSGNKPQMFIKCTKGFQRQQIILCAARQKTARRDDLCPPAGRKPRVSSMVAVQWEFSKSNLLIHFKKILIRLLLRSTCGNFLNKLLQL